MTKIDLAYRLTFDSPFHCGTGLPKGLIDRAVARDGEKYLYVPGSTIKGILREHCEVVARAHGLSVRDPHDENAAIKAFTHGPDIVERIFGSRRREGCLFFDNATMPLDQREFFDGPKKQKAHLFMQTETRAQTAISRRTRTVKQGALYTSEFGVSDLCFDGKIHGILMGVANELSDLPGPYSLFLLIAGLRAAQRIGANRSVGIGRCRFSISELTVDDQPQNSDRYCEEMECLICYETAKKEASL